ncbi:hypothetical protein IJ750_02340 [bacterium]|nr:hypothetical protein [bacterium]
MEGDLFNKNNITNQDSKLNNNFFLHKNNTPSFQNMNDSTKHLNDYDANILEEDAYKKINDDLFKLEYKISKSEDDIKEIENQIQAAKEIQDFELAQSLFLRKKQLETELSEFVSKYNSASLSAKISGGITSQIKTKSNALKNTLNNVARIFFSILPGKISNFIEIKNSLSTLESINKSVDELISLQVPYGEASDRYEKLSKYITKANTIQSSISKHLK